MPPAVCHQWGVDPVAVTQQFHHTKEIQESAYKQGLRNTVNEMQAHILGRD